MDIERTQPLVVMGRDVIVENEILTIHRILPETTRRGQGKDFWLGETYVNDTLQSLKIWREEIKLFTDAGYSKAIFESREPVTVNIQVLPVMKYGKWHVGEVYPKDADNGVTLLSSVERVQQWNADRALSGEYQQIGITAWFVVPKGGGSISWRKNKEGTYTRQAKGDIRIYEAQGSTPVVVDTVDEDEAWIKASMPARHRETLNVMDKATIAEYEACRENVARDTVNALETPQERVIVPYTPPMGTRLVWDSPDYGYQLVEVDMRHNGRVYVFWYVEREIEPGWFYGALPEDAAIMPAPRWAVFAKEVDSEHVARMRRNTLIPERDNGEFVRRKYRGQGI